VEVAYSGRVWDEGREKRTDSHAPGGGGERLRREEGDRNLRKIRAGGEKEEVTAYVVLF